jgi:superfamily II DNA or RNA helicase
MEQEDIRRLLGEELYPRAERAFLRGRVHDMHQQDNNSSIRYLSAKVQDGTDSFAEAWLSEPQDMLLNASCSCSINRNGEGPTCRHIGALLLQYVSQRNAPKAPELKDLMQEHTVTHASEMASSSYASNLDLLFGKKWRGPELESDLQAQKLLRRYREKSGLELEPRRQDAALAESIHLEPELVPAALRRTAPPELRLRIRGNGRSYLVKDIAQMLHAIEQGELLSYGAQLAFVHSEEAFDEQSRKLLALLKRQSELVDYAGEMVRGAGRLMLRRTGSLPLAPDTCDALYDLYLPTGMLSGWLMPEKAPKLQLSVTQKKGGALLCLSPCPGSFAGSRSVYFFTDTKIWACAPRTAEKIIPVLDTLGERELFFTTADLGAFCSYVLPEVREFLDIEDEQRLLLDQIPLIPVVQYYLDAPRMGEVTAHAEFLYGEDKVQPGAPCSGSFLRDEKTELRAAGALERFLHPDLTAPDGTYCSENEDEIERFLEDGIPVLLSLGEVYLTDAFRAMEAPRPKISVGVSVQGSVLDLNIDTGEFPVEELHALLDSLHAKKRYHRLRDGRLLRLDDSMGTLDDLEETLSLAGADLTDGHAALPLYRAPGLDKALAGQNEIGFSRDDAFRRLSRNFHSVADAEYVLPESLQPVLRRYQRTGYRWLRMLDDYGMGGILADDMGLGKTLEVLAYLLSKKQGGETRPSLIVCPASLVLNWAEECARFTPELKTLPVDGTAAHRAALAEHFGEYDIVITGYDLLRRDAELYEKHEFYACILDEAQAIKNQTTQKYKAVSAIKSRVRFALTGTPIENRLSELWSIFSVLMPGYLYPYKTFRERFERPIVQDGSEQAARRLNQITSPFVLRRMKSDVLKELPPKTEAIRHVTMEEQQRKLYLASVLEAKEKLRGAKAGDQIQVMLTRLRQVCCDPRLAVDGWEGGSAKLDACMELISSAVDAGHQILLFSQFTSMLSLITERLEAAEISHFTLQGSTPKPLRAELVRRFNAGEASVFLISLKAGGTGLNLTAADIVIHYDPWWNLAAQNQATDRAYRIGQKNTVQVYKLITQDTIEEKIVTLQNTKQNLADTITGSADGSILSMSPQELLALLDT